MREDFESIARSRFIQVVDDVEADDLQLDHDMANFYGLTSLNKVLFFTMVCDDSGVPLSAFTEHDVARMRSLQDVTEALASRANGGARP
jgi:hypothetical protein